MNTGSFKKNGVWFYGNTITNDEESLFLREFIEERSGQYDPVLILKLREIFPATEAGDDS